MYLSIAPAYVYKITIIETRQFYFGFRKANKVHPNDDLLKVYFSSSEYVKQVIKEQGIEAVKGEVVFMSEDFEEAYWEEQRLIQTHFNDPLIVNKQYQKPNMGFKMFYADPEVYKRAVIERNRRRNSNPEKKKQWLELQQAGHSKRYIVIPPNDEPYEIVNLKEHCRNHNLNHPAMSQVGQGKKPHHKGWGCIRIDAPYTRLS